MTTTTESYAVTRTIAATPHEIFAVLADPPATATPSPPTGSAMRWTPHRSAGPDRCLR